MCLMWSILQTIYAASLPLFSAPSEHPGILPQVARLALDSGLSSLEVEKSRSHGQ
jgi:hypothetical protein